MTNKKRNGTMRRVYYAVLSHLRRRSWVIWRCCSAASWGAEDGEHLSGGLAAGADEEDAAELFFVLAVGGGELLLRLLGELRGGLLVRGHGERGGGGGFRLLPADAGVGVKGVLPGLVGEREPDLVRGGAELVGGVEGPQRGDAFRPRKRAVAGQNGPRGGGGVKHVEGSEGGEFIAQSEADSLRE